MQYASEVAPRPCAADVIPTDRVLRAEPGGACSLSPRATAGDAGGGELVHQRFAECAARTPAATATSIDNSHLTYGELDARSNQLAWELRALGVGPDVPTAICLERSHELLVAMLGILKAGGAYVPLGPDHPADRLALIMSDAAPRVVVTVDRLRGVLPRAGAVLSLDGDAGRLAARPRSAPPPLAGPEHLAYIMYTSGSTGHPKGVMLSHRSLGESIRWTRAHLQLSASDVVLQRIPICFDPSGLEIYAALTSGARLVLVPPRAQHDLAAVLDLMWRERVTMAQFVPSMLAASAELPGFAAGCASLRIATCGGEPLTGELAGRLYATAPEVVLYNMYGPTEFAITATTWVVPREADCGPLPIGRPPEHVRAYVLDGRFQPVPSGATGELYLGGVQVARGYLNRPELTAEKFIPDLFTPDPSARMYRTGDLVRRRPDGALEFLGRVDHQVKVRGCRVELGEVETALSGHPAVHACAVVCRGEGQDARLDAYVVPEPGGGVPHVPDLRAWLGERLPEYMIPSTFTTLDALPLGATGKLDRRALPEPIEDGASHPYIAPRTETEREVAAIWTEVFGRERVGVDDNFFVLGGHSLIAMRILSRVQRRLGVHLPLNAVLEWPTVGQLARVIDERRALDGGAPAEGCSIARASRVAVRRRIARREA